MDESQAGHLFVAAGQALAIQGLGSDRANLLIGEAASGDGAAVLLWLGYGRGQHAAAVIAALEESGLTLVPQTPSEGPSGDIVDRLAAGERFEVEWSSDQP